MLSGCTMVSTLKIHSNYGDVKEDCFKNMELYFIKVTRRLGHSSCYRSSSWENLSALSCCFQAKIQESKPKTAKYDIISLWTSLSHSNKIGYNLMFFDVKISQNKVSLHYKNTNCTLASRWLSSNTKAPKKFYS